MVSIGVLERVCIERGSLKFQRVCCVLWLRRSEPNEIFIEELDLVVIWCY